MGVLYDDIIRASGLPISKNWKNVSTTVMKAPLENIFTLNLQVLNFVTNSKILFLSKGHTTKSSCIIPFISKLKKTWCGSKRDVLELETLQKVKLIYL